MAGAGPHPELKVPTRHWERRKEGWIEEGTGPCRAAQSAHPIIMIPYGMGPSVGCEWGGGGEVQEKKGGAGDAKGGGQLYQRQLRVKRKLLMPRKFALNNRLPPPPRRHVFLRFLYTMHFLIDCTRH